MSAADADTTLTDAEKAGLLETLTPEERAAMEADLSDDEKAALAEIAGEDGLDDDENDGGEGDGEPPGNADDAGAAADAAPAAATEQPAPRQVNDNEPERVVYQADLPADYRERLDGIATKREELAAQFEAGDLSFAEYRAQDGALANEYRDLDKLATKAEIAQEMQAQDFNARWTRTVIEFSDHVLKTDGLDLRQDQKAQQKLDTYVKAVYSDPDNAGLSMREALDTAYGMMRLVYKPSSQAKRDAGQTDDKQPVKDDKQTKEKIDKAKAARTNKPSDLPASLAGVPGGSGPGDLGGGEFADLDGLEGIDLEMAIAKMSPAQREKFASLG